MHRFHSKIVTNNELEEVSQTSSKTPHLLVITNTCSKNYNLLFTCWLSPTPVAAVAANASFKISTALDGSTYFL